MRLLFIFAPLMAAVLPWAVATESMIAQDLAVQCDGNDVPGLDDLPACKRLNETLTECAQASTSDDTVECFCTQSVLNAFVECKGEKRQCTRGYAFDSSSDELIALWHDTCGKFLTFTPTTPILTPLATTVDLDACKSAFDACFQRGRGAKSCAEAHSGSPTQAVSCLCEPSHLSVASVCLVDGAKCQLTQTANISTEVEYRYCQPTWLSSVAHQTANVSVSHATQPPTTRPPTTQETISFALPTVASTRTQSAASGQVAPVWTLLSIIGMASFRLAGSMLMSTTG